MTRGTPGTPASPIPDHAARLVHGYFEQMLTDAEHADLASLLRTDPTIAAAFARWSMTTAHLLDAPVTAAASSKPDLSPLRAKVRVSGVSGFRYQVSGFKLAAAALLLATAAVAVYVFAFSSKPETRNPKLASPIATILDTTDGTLAVGDRIAAAGDEITKGELSLDTGSADFRLTNGVSVRLTGSTLLTVHDAMSATLARGSADFDCPHDARGYTVHLPGDARVVDLGTGFRLRALDDGRSVCHVTEGAVNLIESDGSNNGLPAGTVAYIDVRGHLIGPPQSDRPSFADGFDTANSGVAVVPGGGSIYRQFDPNAIDTSRPIYVRVDVRDTGGRKPVYAARLHFVGPEMHPSNTLGFGVHEGQARIQVAGRSRLFPADVADGGWHTLIAKIEFNARRNEERVTLFVDPDGLESGRWSATTYGDIGVDSLGDGIELHNFIAGPAVEYDNLRIAHDWAAAAVDTPASARHETEDETSTRTADGNEPHGPATVPLGPPR